MPSSTSHLNRSYRRGAILGLTIAEAFVLIAFALLLLFAFWHWDMQRENTAEVLAFKGLSVERQLLIVESVQDGSMEAFATLKEQGVDLRTPASLENPQEKWRFIDADDQRRILDAAQRLPDDVQRDLADLVEAESVVPALKQLSALEALISSAQSVDLETILEANARLSSIAARIQNAAAKEAELVDALRRQLGEIVGGIGGEIDASGSIILPDAVLFERGEARITATMREFLAAACRPWLATLRDAGVPISEVKIEGHASSEWGGAATSHDAYLGNLNLSQQRSQAVVRMCLDHVSDAEVLDWARRHLIGVGYSSVRPVLRDGVEDLGASRRVVFSVAVDRDALIEEIGENVAVPPLSVPADASKPIGLFDQEARAGYDRALFGTWGDLDGDCIDTRHEMLGQLSIAEAELSEDGCRVIRGQWEDVYTGERFTDPTDLEIDHLVPLAWAWDRGADGWTEERRLTFFNDQSNLFVVSSAINRSKGARGPLEWLPPQETFQCQYVVRFRRVASVYGLLQANEEDAALRTLQVQVCGR